jgi:hypothetical protein
VIGGGTPGDIEGAAELEVPDIGAIGPGAAAGLEDVLARGTGFAVLAEEVGLDTIGWRSEPTEVVEPV